MSVSDHEKPPTGYASEEPPADVVQTAKDAFALYKHIAELARQRDQARDLAVDRDNRLAAVAERLTKATLEFEWQADPQQAAVLALPLLQESLAIAEGRS